MFFYAITGLVNAITSTFLGFFVFLKNRRARINQIFALFCLTVAIWSYSYYFWQISKNAETALFWSRSLMAGAIFISICYLHFVLEWFNKIKKNKKLLIFGYIVSFFFFFTNFTFLFVKNVSPKLGFSFWPEPGIFYHPFLLIWFFYAIYAIYLVWIEYKHSRGLRQLQSKYILLGVIIGLIGGSTNYFLWYGIPIPPVGNILVLAYVGFTTYAIVKYRFLDIRLVVGRTAIYFFSFATVVGFGFLLNFANLWLGKPISMTVLGPLTLILGILLFQFIFKIYQKLASRYFYYTFYSYQQVLTDLGRNLTRVLELDELSSLIVSTLMETMKLDRAVVLLRESGDGEYRIQKNIGFREENGISLVRDNFLTIWLEKTQNPLVYEEISLIIRDTKKEEERERLKTLQANMKRIEAALCLPLLIEDKIIGMIVLGNKISGEPYSVQDIELLTTLSSQASIALQNAQLYSEVKGFSKKLEKEVEKATKELKEAYEELKVLDKAKSEFISIASHQLRTPLTAIKGYISMILEGSYGVLSGRMKEKMENVFQSNERLIKLVNDLLNVSRIETGRMEMNPEKLQIEEIINSVIEELKGAAKEKDIYLKFEKPTKTLAKISVDRDKIRQVIMNVVDNAIKYTNKGGVTIQIKIEDKRYKIQVSDTGEGLTKEELSKMFESFSRGTAGTRFYTEGVGLGLYVARKFVEMHQGKIWVESKGKGKGSTFFIELPVTSKIKEEEE